MSPADMPDGHVVRLVVFRRLYFSPVMSPGEAQAEADRLRAAIHDAGGTYRLVGFTMADGCTTTLRARQVMAIDNGPAAILREQESGPVHVHLHMNGSESGAASEAAAAVVAAGVVPTPLALAGRRQPR